MRHTPEVLDPEEDPPTDLLQGLEELPRVRGAPLAWPGAVCPMRDLGWDEKGRAPVSETKTKRIRIAVAVCNVGHASAGVDQQCDPNDWIWDGLECGKDCGGPGREHLVWVEVDVPLPEAKAAVGTVRSVEPGPS